MPLGTVIFLNGTSSSGKTSISFELQQILDEPYLHISVDKFLYMLPIDYLNGGKQADATKDAMLKVIKGRKTVVRRMRYVVIGLQSVVCFSNLFTRRTSTKGKRKRRSEYWSCKVSV